MTEEEILTVDDLTPPNNCPYHKKIGCGVALEGGCDKAVPNLCLIYATWIQETLNKNNGLRQKTKSEGT